MTASHDRSRARSHRAAAGRAALGALLLIALLPALPALRHLPAAPASVRVGGISIEWWYGGLLAPVAGWIVAIWALKGPRVAARAAARETGRADNGEAGASRPRLPADG